MASSASQAMQIAAGEVGDGQRIAIAPIGEHELALVVGAPQVVGLAGHRQRRPPSAVAPPLRRLTSPWRSSTACTVEIAGRCTSRIKPRQPLPDLGRAPGRLLPLQPDDQRLDLQRQLVGMPVGTPRAVGEPLHSAVAIALEDFVAGLARDRELLAQPRQSLAVQQPCDELHPLVHEVTLLPRHLCSPAKGQKCHPCLRYEMSPLSQEGHPIAAYPTQQPLRLRQRSKRGSRRRSHIAIQQRHSDRTPSTSLGGLRQMSFLQSRLRHRPRCPGNRTCWRSSSD